MKTKLLNIVMILLLMFPFYVFSQGHPERAPNLERRHHFQERQKEFEARRIAFITERVGLTPQEAQNFWPVYNEYMKKKREMNRQHRMRQDDKNIDYDALSEEELQKMALAEIERLESMLEFRKDYHDKFLEVLPVKKVVMLYEAEKEFKRILLRDLRKHRRGAR